ncbi:MAG: FmdB family zinc ribbon protein [Vicinamibacterales bacterium]
MPLYEYECQSCHKRFERIQKFSDPPVETCPECGGPVTKLISSPAIQFKGSGWYVTDYARKSESGSGSSGSSPKGEAKGDSTSESKGGSSSSSASGSSSSSSSTSSETKSSGGDAAARPAKKDGSS